MLLVVAGCFELLAMCWIHEILAVLDLCKKKSCEYYGKCITRADNTAECVCPLCDATTKYNPVCGDDGMTYASECHLQATACTGRRDLKVAKKTACGKMKATHEYY